MIAVVIPPQAIPQPNANNEYDYIAGNRLFAYRQAIYMDHPQLPPGQNRVKVNPNTISNYAWVEYGIGWARPTKASDRARVYQYDQGNRTNFASITEKTFLREFERNYELRGRDYREIRQLDAGEVDNRWNYLFRKFAFEMKFDDDQIDYLSIQHAEKLAQLFQYLLISCRDRMLTGYREARKLRRGNVVSLSASLPRIFDQQYDAELLDTNRLLIWYRLEIHNELGPTVRSRYVRWTSGLNIEAIRAWLDVIRQYHGEVESDPEGFFKDRVKVVVDMIITGIDPENIPLAHEQIRRGVAFPGEPDMPVPFDNMHPGLEPGERQDNVFQRPPLPNNRPYIDIAGYFEQLDTEIYTQKLALSRQVEIQNPPRNTIQLSESSKKRQPSFYRRHIAKKDCICTRFEACEDEQYVQVGAYELLDPNTQMFYKDNLMKHFAKDGSILYNPETTSFSCFLMAFLRAEVYEYHIQKNLTGVTYEGMNPLQNFPEICCELPQWSSLQVDYPFVYYNVDKQDYYLRLFTACDYPTKTEEEKQQYHYYWELAAREIELFVKKRLGNWSNVNCMQSIAQDVAKVFEVQIQIFNIRKSSLRDWFITWLDKDRPYSEIPVKDLFTDEGVMRVISLVYDNGHCIPIIHLRRYLKHGMKDIRKDHYCIFCEQSGCSKGFESKSKIMDHMQKCLSYNWNKHMGCEYNKLPLEQEKIMDMCIPPVKYGYHFHTQKMEHTCVYCHEIVTQSDFIYHHCLIKPKKIKDVKENDKFYVYDIEAAQIPHGENHFYHVCNLLIFRKMYPETQEEKEGLIFENEYAFMEHLLDNNDMYKDCTIFAHNGGSYDHQFIVRYLERLNIEHTLTPTPNSLHKFLAVHVPVKNITFLDFVYFMPGSLKSICESFNLTITKGDFPHRFNNQIQTNYIGAIPPLDTSEDYWCLKTKKNPKDVEELRQFYQDQCLLYCHCHESNRNDTNNRCLNCQKSLWNMRDQLIYYCQKDVIVLADACAKYRDQLLQLNSIEEDTTSEGWKPSNIDPYDFLTVPQLALQILLSGFPNPIFHINLDKRRRGQTMESLYWLEFLRRSEGLSILHRQNHYKEYYDYEMNQFADGYDPTTKQMFICLDCQLWGCPTCYYEEIENDFYHEFMNPLYSGHTYKDIHEIASAYIHHWREKGHRVIFQCEARKYEPTPYISKCLQTVSQEQFFYGGRTEVFHPFHQVLDHDHFHIKYLDVCSLYPYVCAFKELPVGIPEFIPGFQVDSYRLFHADENIKYWGYIRALVQPNPDCTLGLLPNRSNGKLIFSVEEQSGCWGLDEMELAVRQGYRILEIYEIIHWKKSERSNRLFRGYVDFFLKIKQQSEGWIKLGGKENMTELEKDQLIQQLYADNGYIGKIAKEKVTKNPTQRALAKLFLNSLWGKFAQKPKASKQGILYGLNDFIKIWGDSKIKPESFLFREIGNGLFKYQYDQKDEYAQQNAKGNIFLAAKVTEHARCVLHQQMLHIGPEKVIYCDTDSIILCTDKLHPLNIGNGLGKWVDEYPTKVINQFYGLAPKFYMLQFRDQQIMVKVKGVQLTNSNKDKFTLQNVQKLIAESLQGIPSYIECDAMCIQANCHGNRGLQYGVLTTRYGKKLVKLVISKRMIHGIVGEIDWEHLEMIRTLPFGHNLLLDSD